MRVGRHNERARQDVAVRHHDLMADAGAGRVEVDALLSGEGLDLAVLGQVGLRLVLNVVVERENRLARIVDAIGTDGAKLLHDRGGVVVSHHVARSQRYDIAGAHRAIRTLRHVALGNLLNDRLTHVANSFHSAMAASSRHGLLPRSSLAAGYLSARHKSIRPDMLSALSRFQTASLMR